MTEREENSYILGTNAEELFRLGLQHQLWASEAHAGWRTAGFTSGGVYLDLGSGPGFCSKELSFLSGAQGNVIAVDKSQYFIAHVEKVKKLHHLNIDPICSDFNDMDLNNYEFDGMYCRWAMAWIDNPKEILSKVLKRMKVGSKMVIHEYYNWSTHQIQPQLPHLSKAIAAALKSFNDSPGKINIGKQMPEMMEDIGMKVNSIRPMSKMARSMDDFWHWPKSFYFNYFPRLAKMGLLTKEEVDLAYEDLKQMESTPGATICCPLMVEVIGEKQ